jgi:hypothetical protein
MLLRQHAELISHEQVEAGIIEEIINKDEMFALLPFMAVTGKAYVYDRENPADESSYVGATFLDPNEDVPEQTTSFVEVVSKLRILIGDADVDKFLQETMSDTNDQLALQLAAKAKGMNRMFKKTLVNGDNTANTKEFDGLGKLVTAGQTLEAGTNGAALTFGMLDELADMVPNGADALIMRAGTIRAYRALLRLQSGTDASMIEIENFGVPVLAHNGMPILRNDFLSGAETQGTNVKTCSIYAARFNLADGVHGIFSGSNAGIRVEDIGTVQNRDATRTRLKWYCGLALKSTKSLARLKGVTNV